MSQIDKYNQECYRLLVGTLQPSSISEEDIRVMAEEHNSAGRRITEKQISAAIEFWESMQIE